MLPTISKPQARPRSVNSLCPVKYISSESMIVYHEWERIVRRPGLTPTFLDVIWFEGAQGGPPASASTPDFSVFSPYSVSRSVVNSTSFSRRVSSAPAAAIAAATIQVLCRLAIRQKQPRNGESHRPHIFHCEQAQFSVTSSWRRACKAGIMHRQQHCSRPDQFMSQRPSDRPLYHPHGQI
jgi:hypothetical protein